jgi:hypothetical protein
MNYQEQFNNYLQSIVLSGTRSEVEIIEKLNDFFNNCFMERVIEVLGLTGEIKDKCLGEISFILDMKTRLTEILNKEK